MSHQSARSRLSLDHWPTGAKLFLILSAALLPLALIAMFATLQTTRIAGAEARARLRVAAAEGSRALAIELVGDMTAVRASLGPLSTDSGDAPSCARIQGVFAQQAAAGIRFAILDRAGRLVCGSPLGALADASVDSDGAIGARLIDGTGLLLAVRGDAGVHGRVFFPVRFLTGVARPSGADSYGTTLIHSDDELDLSTPEGGRAWRQLRTRTDLGIAGLLLETSMPAPAITSSFLIAMLLPLMMWAAAAGIGWFVVDRLLIRPLRDLRASVAGFVPGEVIDVGATRIVPAQEIRELGDTFRAISRTVAIHEAGLAEGLVRQTKLTREVHHRVKNNLQVVSSLINFHARGAPTVEATAAFATIQRRVDALAVVHRNHFAEMEENRGLNARAVLGELASSIRATAPEGSHGLSITLDVDPYLLTQDVAVAVAFLMTETIELALNCDTAAQIRVSMKPCDVPQRSLLRVVSRSLVESDCLRDLVRRRYGRVMEGLSRQLRSSLHHDPLTGAYEIGIAVLGRD